MSWQLIESDEALEDILVQANQADAVAIDTEFMRRNTFYPKVALLQLCFDDRAWLIDPLAISDLSGLIDFMENTSVIKVVHSASEDLEVFLQWLGVLPKPLFDTQKAAALLSLGFGLGYSALVDKLCGVVLDKGETRSDWLARPLSESQCEYAAQDVTYLLTLWQILKAQCERQNKMDWVLSEGDAANTIATVSVPYYPKIKLAWKLNAKQLGALRAISEWRESIARERDKPRGWIIDDKACLDLSCCSAQNWAELKLQVELPAPALRHHGEELLALLIDQRQRPDSSLPAPLPAPLDAVQRARMKTLKRAAGEIAETLGVAPEILLQKKDYEGLLREHQGESVDIPVTWGGWRGEKIIAPLRALLKNGGV
ncbi:MAG: ribonuclease D [Halioglobus sp.]|jgi:ribonuclease D